MGVLPKIGAEASLTQRAYEVLRETILSNRFRPGQILSEENLAEELAISRTPVRAALKRLAFEHLVILNPSKNIVVADISRGDLRDITAVRLALEPAAVRLLAEGMTAGTARALHEELDRQRTIYAADDPAGLILAEYDFHTRIARSTGNRWMAEMVEAVNLASRRYLGLSESLARHWEGSLREHAEILEAMEQKDADTAAERIRSHICRLGKQIFP